MRSGGEGRSLLLAAGRYGVREARASATIATAAFSATATHVATAMS